MFTFNINIRGFGVLGFWGFAVRTDYRFQSQSNENLNLPDAYL